MERLTDENADALMLSALFQLAVDDRELASLAGKAWKQLQAERDALIADNARLAAELDALNYTLRKLEFERQAAFNDGVAFGRSKGAS